VSDRGTNRSIESLFIMIPTVLWLESAELIFGSSFQSLRWPYEPFIIVEVSLGVVHF
jgi:hypothetical protein